MSDRDHADFGGSSADKVLNCPGYLNAVKGLPESPPSDASVEGTAHHALNEHLLRSGQNAEDWVGKPWIGEIPEKWAKNVYTDDSVERFKVWLKAVYDYADPLAFTTKMEERVVMSSIDASIFGSADLIAWSVEEKTLVVKDYKNGFHEVSVTETPQLPFYAVAGVDTFGIPVRDDWQVVLVIVQPSARVPISVYVTGGNRVPEWRGMFRAAFARAQRPDAPRVSGEHCGYCRAGGTCLARAEAKRLSVRKDFAAGAAPQSLTVEQIANILRVKPEVDSWLDEVEKYALSEILAGKTIPGFQVVEGRLGNRKWKDENAAAEYLAKHLGEFAYERKLISPTIAEKKLGDKYAKVEPFIGREPGKPKLACADAKGVAYSKQAQARAEFTS